MSPPGNDHDFLQNKALSPTEAMQLFDDLAERPGYVHNSPKDGCAARAHLMCLHMQRRGLEPAKAWAFEGEVLSPDRGDDLLSFCTPRGHIVNWWYHVAPAIPVKMPDGTQRLHVYDPALFDGPVDVDTWRWYMGAKEGDVFVAAFGQPTPGLAGWYRPLPAPHLGRSHTPEEAIEVKGCPRMDDHEQRWARKYLDKYMPPAGTVTLNRVVYASDLRAQAEAAGYPVIQRGHGWVSHALYKQDPSCIYDAAGGAPRAQFSRFARMAPALKKTAVKLRGKPAGKPAP